MAKGEGKVVAQNKKAHHDYTIVDTLEAGMVLTGTEIKSVRAARINLKDGFAQVKNGEVWLSNVHIAPYEEGNIWNQEPERRRKLLLHKKQDYDKRESIKRREQDRDIARVMKAVNHR